MCITPNKVTLLFFCPHQRMHEKMIERVRERDKFALFQACTLSSCIDEQI